MLTVKDVARRLGVSPGLVYGEIRCGRLRCHRFGKRAYRVSEADVQQYIAACRQRDCDSVGTSQDTRPKTACADHTGFRHIDVSRLLSRRT
jgi:excisionase family DNA binding protein